jgi:hypothetical protein
MEIRHKITDRYPEILIASASILLGFLIEASLDKFSSLLFDTPTKALLSGFIVLALISVITISIVSILIRKHDEQLERFEKKLENTKDYVKVSASLSEIGISDAVPNQSGELFDDLCATAEIEIKILQTYLGSLRQLPDSIFDAVRRGVKVKLLILDPSGDIIFHRLRDIGLPSDTHAHKDAYGRLKILLKKKVSNPERFQVKIYNNIPPFALYASEKKVRLGLFWHGDHSPSGPHILVDDCNSIIGEYALETFEEIWQKAPTANVI